MHMVGRGVEWENVENSSLARKAIKHIKDTQTFIRREKKKERDGKKEGKKQKRGGEKERVKSKSMNGVSI